MEPDATPQKNLTVKQRKALAVLVSGGTQQDAQQAAGVARNTIWRWLNDATFDHELRKQSDAAVTHAARRLTGHLDTAVAVLVETMEDTELAPGVRVRAALGLIDRQIRLVEVSQVIERLDALERVLNQN